jgi:peptide/nickel transport system substrate-binding protein
MRHVLALFCVLLLSASVHAAEPPLEPLVTTQGEPGKAGGEIEMLLGRAKDIRLLGVYGYSRLVGYNEKLEIVPDILRHFEVKDGREFTLYLRRGHKWSDGHPFTAEDFRYFFEDMAFDAKFTKKLGPPGELLLDGKLPTFQVIDELTIRIAWEQPNPNFLYQLASAQPVYIYRPAHYMKRFHAKHAAEADLEKLVKKVKAKDWVGLHYKMDRQYNLDNPELPTLDPWINTTQSPADRYVLVRNPFFHRVDAKGQQLPYLDRIVVNISNAKLIPAKVAAGEADLQARNLDFKNYTILKQGEKRNGYKVHLWRSGKGSQLAFYPNLNVKDEAWRTLLRDVRFRRALSLAVDRHEINQVVFFGLAVESGNTVLPGTPLHDQERQRRWATHDPEAANKLLDEIGLTKRNAEGTRLLPDGRPLEIVVETAGEDLNESDILELVTDSWREVGVKLFTKAFSRDVLRSRATSGETIMSTWFGWENGIATADSQPKELAPTGDDQLNWPLWGLNTMTSGKGGEAIEDEAARRLLTLYGDWSRAMTTAERARIWHEMLTINAEQVFTIGTVCGVPQPVVATSRLRNIPSEALYNWDPGAYFGIHRLDTFWLEGE